MCRSRWRNFWKTRQNHLSSALLSLARPASTRIRSFAANAQPKHRFKLSRFHFCRNRGAHQTTSKANMLKNAGFDHLSSDHHGFHHGFHGDLTWMVPSQPGSSHGKPRNVEHHRPNSWRWSRRSPCRSSTAGGAHGPPVCWSQELGQIVWRPWFMVDISILTMVIYGL